ncbi:MAG TPA: ABC transporter ATP-binding protein [Mycobacteriales bacterium]|jgi:ABC-2 type transport system ATP-binding protein|nr:ABC transporter ATP-binding protein [Mycobacteriales bacterium]
MSRAIATTALCKSYGRHEALRDLNLRIDTGEVFGYLGPNGAGKSTTIRLLLDLLRPTSGRIEVLGHDPRAGGTELRRRIGYLAGDFIVGGRQTAGEALTLLGNLRGGVAAARIRDLAKRLDLDLGRTVRELSKGNRQKVGLVQAFMHSPELLILDEPTSGLDPLLQQEFLRMVREVRADGRTVFMSSHIMSEVQATADRVGIVRAGRLITVDTVEALRGHAVRKVAIQFAGSVPVSDFAELPGIQGAEIRPVDGGSVLHCHLSGHADDLVKAAARHTVLTLEVEEPDLEELFLTLYTDNSIDQKAASHVAA